MSRQRRQGGTGVRGQMLILDMMPLIGAASSQASSVSRRCVGFGAHNTDARPRAAVVGLAGTFHAGLRAASLTPARESASSRHARRARAQCATMLFCKYAGLKHYYAD